MQKYQLNGLSFSDKKPENFNTLSTQNLDHIKQSTSNILESEKKPFLKLKGKNTYLFHLPEGECLYDIEILESGTIIHGVDLKGYIKDFKIKEIEGEEVIVTEKQIYFLNNGKLLERTGNQDFIILKGKIYGNSFFANKYKSEYSNFYNINYYNTKFELDNFLILDNYSGDFTIFNKNTQDKIYKSKKGEKLKKDDFGKLFEPLTIQKPYGFDGENITSQINTNTGEEKFDQYNDKYEVTNPKYGNINKILLKLFKGKLLLPKFSSIEEFLNSPFFGDIVSVAMEENKEKEQYRRKTFYECILLDDFQNIYKEGGNIFEDKADNIIHNISFRLNKNFKLEEIKQLISKKLDSNKRKITN